MFHVEQSGRDAFVEHFKNVSRETIGKLDRYAELLNEWNQKFNLVSASTLPHVWNRHFLDSAQLFSFIPTDAKTIVDLGSGAGFPGLVLNIMGVPNITLIESTGKKANFLREIISDLKLNAVVCQERIEALGDLKFDVITARAVALLPALLELAKPLMHKESLCLFLKGQNAELELTESAKYWKFNVEKHTSISDPSGSVLKISKLKFLQSNK